MWDRESGNPPSSKDRSDAVLFDCYLFVLVNFSLAIR